ncbi:MAG: tellurite resistance TerB family protein [Parasphingopyxis sp.]|uniref:tellurite resistance TerB family protein n=1 Tax=Parasphingopyxis sp. TaxID=1920299 RepID=UPI002623BD09|nr:tellurite resistance TerB family protein [uncultured Parasphingopyxis sp.]
MSATAGAVKGLFAGLRGKGVSGELDTQIAVMLPIVAAMVADGMVEDEELAQIHAVCDFSPIYERNSLTQNEMLVGRAIRIIDDLGLENACRAAREQLSRALCETAFVHAVRVIFCDGYVGQLEREVVEQMIGWLEIDRDRARMMTEVVSIMQHSASA